MGCSTGRPLSNTITSIFPETINGIKVIPIDTQRERYLKNHENFTMLQLNTSFAQFLNESKPEDETHLNTFIDLLFNKFYTEFTNMKMTKDDVKDTIMEQILEQAILDELNFKTINFQNIIGEVIENAEMGYLNSKKEEIPQEILDLVEQRKIASENKDWAKSDELRDLINEKGYSVKDTKNGQEIYGK